MHITPSNPKDYFKAYKVGRLYFKFIRGTCLETDGWRADRLLNWMIEQGFIDLIKCSINNETKWCFKAGKYVSQRELLKMIYMPVKAA